jgi:hypothetical protein
MRRSWRSALATFSLLAGIALLGCGNDESPSTSDESASTSDEDGLRVLVGGGDHRPENEWCLTLRTCLKDIRWAEYTTKRAAGIGIGPAPGCDPRSF